MRECAGELTMPRADLVPNCERCAALCCVATSFDASEDFAISKAAGVRCPHLASDCRCTIHRQLLERGFTGCTLYDCYGAGQRVSQAFADQPSSEPQRDEAFRILRVVHELLWQLTEAAKLCPISRSDVAAQLAQEIELLDAIASGPAQMLTSIDLRPREIAARAALQGLGQALGGRRRAAHTLQVVPR
jgi:hypothetical protein